MPREVPDRDEYQADRQSEQAGRWEESKAVESVDEEVVGNRCIRVANEMLERVAKVVQERQASGKGGVVARELRVSVGVEDC